MGVRIITPILKTRKLRLAKGKNHLCKARLHLGNHVMVVFMLLFMLLTSWGILTQTEV